MDDNPTAFLSSAVFIILKGGDSDLLLFAASFYSSIPMGGYMSTHRLLKIIAVAVVMLFAGALVIPWHSSAASALAAPVQGGPKFQMVNTYQFHSAIAAADYFNDELINNSLEDRFYQAALSLPDNIKINRLVVYFSDDSEQDLIVALWRFDPSTGEHLEMATVSSWGTQGQYLHSADSSIIEPVVNQQKYSYYIEVGMPPAGSALRVAAVRIDYSDKGENR
jgi:hypothetical protein